METVDTKYELDINPTKVCRLCLAQPSELFNIYSNSIVDGYIISVPDMLKYTVDIAVITGDKLPDKICSECKKQIVTFYTFKQKTKRTEKSLFSMFKPEVLHKNGKKHISEAVHCTLCNLIFSDDQAYNIHYQQMHPEILEAQTSSDKAPEFETYTFEDGYENEDSNESGAETKVNDIDMLTMEMESIPVRNKRPATREIPTRAAKKRIIEKPSTSAIDFKSESEFEEAFDSNDENYIITAEEQEGTDSDDCHELYECPICATQFVDKIDYLNHCKEHDGIEFQCESCGDMCSNAEDLLGHDCSGNDEKLSEAELFCIPCNKRLKSASQLNQHNKMHDSMSIILAHTEFYPCHDCCLLFVAKDALTEHNAEHHPDMVNKESDDEASDSLPNVDESCTDYQFLEDDKQDYKDVPYSCGVCNAMCGNIPELKNHVIFHAKKYPCPIYECGCQYDQLSRLNIHVLNKHINKQNMQCFHCGLPFQTYDDLQAHLKNSCKEKKFKCPECDKKFFSKKALFTHLKTLREKKHKCKQCDKLFKQAGELKIHLRSHTNERPFECTICGKRYKTSSMRAAHMDSHINGKTFECSLCDKKLQSRTSYRNHMKRHTEEKKFTCEHCQKKFFTRYHLRLHQSKIHKNLMTENENVVLEGVDESDDMIVYE